MGVTAGTTCVICGRCWPCMRSRRWPCTRLMTSAEDDLWCTADAGAGVDLVCGGGGVPVMRAVRCGSWMDGGLGLVWPSGGIKGGGGSETWKVEEGGWFGKEFLRWCTGAALIGLGAAAGSRDAPEAVEDLVGLMTGGGGAGGSAP